LETSILTSVKKAIGLTSSDDTFDIDIIMHINSALLPLTQIGIGPVTGYQVIGVIDDWTDFLGTRIDLDAAKSYIYMKVRLIFDPPSNAFVVTSMERQLDELIARLSIQVETVIEEAI